MKAAGIGMLTPDWSRSDVMSALKKKRISLAKLSREHGLNSGTLYNALERPWPKGEQIIAEAIGLEPEQIWPSRYEKEQANA